MTIGILSRLPSPRDLWRAQEAERRRAAFAPVALAAMQRGAAKRKAAQDAAWSAALLAGGERMRREDEIDAQLRNEAPPEMMPDIDAL